MLGFLGLAVPNFLLALVTMYFSFRYLGTNVGGLFSNKFISAPYGLRRLHPDQIWSQKMEFTIKEIRKTVI